MGIYGEEIPSQILKEHYRCHPQIIEFCNQKYYDGQLIPYTDPAISDCPLLLYKTSEGNQGLKFVDDPHMVNVAVSRAVKQFILVTDYNLFFKKGKEIPDLIRYIQYNTLEKNIIESQVTSVFDLLYRQYSSKLNSLKAKMNPNARYQSEEVVRVLLEEIFSNSKYKQYSYIQGMLLRNLLNTVELLTPEELRFVNNRASLDFVVFYKQDKSCTLVVEVDGFDFHENNPEQLRRDALKDGILKKYEIPILRLATNGSREKERIEEMLET